MKRKPVSHERVFSSKDYAENYAKQHWKMAEKFGQDYGQKLAAQKFSGGKIIDVGIDLSEPLLDIANEAAKEANLSGRVRFEKADVQQIPCPENTFDVAININMLHLVDDPIRMLNEIERVLSPGGYLFISDLRRSLLGYVEDEIRSALTIPEAKNLFEESELRHGNYRWGLLWWKFEAK